MPKDFEPRGCVVTYSGGNKEAADLHERERIRDLSTVIAEMTDRDFGGEFKCKSQLPGNSEIFVVPFKTILGLDVARDIGIHTKDDLFGGVVDTPYKGTKAISHGLVSADAVRPVGWSNEFSDETNSVVLPGYTGFERSDIFTAADNLLQSGFRVRGKRTLAAGGGDQHVIDSAEALEPILARIPDDEIGQFGYVVESNLHPEGLSIRSIGQVEIDGTIISYFGTQRETRLPNNDVLYGGSDLYIARGDYAELLKHVDDEDTKTAITQAGIFDKAAQTHLGVIASRRNYDIAQGILLGQPVSGVLEQSWRIGGASGPEIIAIDLFRRDPSAHVVRGSSYNVFSATGDFDIPGNARVHFEGVDPTYQDYMVTYTTVEKEK